MTITTLNRAHAISAIALCFLATAGADTLLAEEATARVGERTITNADVLRAARGSADPTALEAALAERIEFELLLTSALASGFDQRPEVAEAIRRLIVERYSREVLAPQLNAVSVSEEEIAAHYQARRSELVAPPAVRGAVVRLSISPRVSEERRAALAARADEAQRAALELPLDARGLGAVAVNYSDHQASRYRGGETDWLTAEEPGPWEPEVLAAIGALSAPGEVGPVVQTANAFYVVRLLEKKPERTLALSEVRDRLEYELFRSKRAAARDAVFAGLRSQIPVEVDPAALDRMRGAEPQPPKNPE